jgi:hypothetical protein
MKNNSINKTRFIVASLVSAYFVYYCFTYTKWHFIDNINLIIHEAGHFVFLFFGQFIQFLGGSILQIALPIIFVIYFYKNQEYFSSSLLLFWVGQNFINVSVYISDAIVMQLPLIGGEHDWNNILQMSGLIEHTKEIGSSVYVIGIVIIFIAIYFSFANSLNERLEK